ncbi:hypothetical protein ACLJYM_13740 [Rhizobium giardinii]|uniref:hypothetical protein n=1 Tax=Rhizobium giardinii TaxID=56731 RepID=UPI0039E09CA4
MKKSDERKLHALEALYSSALLAELKLCAEGKWGLFGQNGVSMQKIGRYSRSKFSSAEVEEILTVGEEIRQLRSKLGYVEQYEPHARLLRLRSLTGENRLGEPRLAKQWLSEMAAD